MESFPAVVIVRYSHDALDSVTPVKGLPLLDGLNAAMKDAGLSHVPDGFETNEFLTFMMRESRPAFLHLGIAGVKDYSGLEDYVREAFLETLETHGLTRTVERCSFNEQEFRLAVVAGILGGTGAIAITSSLTNIIYGKVAYRFTVEGLPLYPSLSMLRDSVLYGNLAALASLPHMPEGTLFTLTLTWQLPSGTHSVSLM